MYSAEELTIIMERLERELLAARRVSFSFDRAWLNNFEAKPGLYAIFSGDTLLYIGESADLRFRMQEVKRTVNHSFRKKLGIYLFNASLEGYKFSKEVEAKLDQYYRDNLSFASLPLSFGRLEVETFLINKYKLSLLNSVGIRGTNSTRI
jgi:hypothetical protein